MAMGIDYYSYPPHVSTLCGKTEITEDNYDIFEEKNIEFRKDIWLNNLI